MGSVSLIGGIPRADMVDTAMRVLAAARRTATGATVITPSGETRYITRAEAERHVAEAPPPGEVKQ